MPTVPPDPPSRSTFRLIEPRPQGPRRVVLAGVLVAAVLGVGLGLWARPAPERPPQPRPPAPAPQGPEPQLQIVLDDTPAPLGLPLEVLPPDMIAAAGTSRVLARSAGELSPLDPALPALPVERLVMANATSAPAAVDRPSTPNRSAAARPAGKAKSAQPVRLAQSEKRQASKPQTKRSRSSKASPTKAKTPKTRAETATKLAQAKPSKSRMESKTKASKPAKTEIAKARTKPKATPVKVAKAKAPTSKSAKSQSAKSRKPTQLAEAKAARLKPKPKPAPQAAPARKLRGEASTRVARADPPDRRLEVRERQLQRAYAQAEAAGVPSQALRRQQARWVEARNAAEREAPWAVEDVYLARISELHDLTRDARDEWRRGP